MIIYHLYPTTNVKNKYVTLGDHTKLPILGYGTAKCYLNGKIILIRNALHVQGLRAPLYSLRKHRNQPGCGIYGQEGIGSFILFPSFALQIDDTNDNIVCFPPIGCAQINRLDYTEPRPQAVSSRDTSACPLHVIPDDAAPATSDSDEVTTSLPSYQPNQSPLTEDKYLNPHVSPSVGG